ncbi:MAG: radical SAM protein [bacterium]|nr:radical SAM protein [bacterium]
MKIVLISTSSDIQAFGLRTISSCLKKEGFNVKLIFLPNLFWIKYEERSLRDVVKIARGAGLIGVSLMTNFFDNAVQVTQRLKKDLNIPIIWGGIHPTIRPEESLNHADMVCIGEGEETIVELAKRMQEKKNYQKVQGVWLKNKNKLIKNKLRPPLTDLNSIPFQDYDYKNHYILHNNLVQKMDEKLFKRHSEGIYMTIPTRGCPFGCSYCCNNILNKMYHKKQIVRERSIDNLIEELVFVKDKLPVIDTIKFDDDAFFIKKVEEIRKFSQRYKRLIGLPLIVTGANPSTLTREKLALLVEAGLTTLRMGIQTGSQRTKELYGRRDTNEQVKKAVEIINEFKNKIQRPVYDIILENPWETEEDEAESLLFLCQLPSPYVLQFFSLTFYPGTDFYNRAKKEGLITDDLKEVYRKYFHGVQKSYINSLFFLLNEYGIGGGGIPPKIMSLLVNPKYKKLKINLVLYYLLKAGSLPYHLNWLFYSYKNGLIKVLKNKDWYRITDYLKKRWNFERGYNKSREARIN